MESDITFDCPNCLRHYVIWDESKGDLPEEHRKQYEAIVKKQIEYGFCKWCKRDDGIPTTLEMDGLIEVEHIQNRFFVHKPCIGCLQYSVQDLRIGDVPCKFCGGSMGKASNYWRSLRTPRTDRKLGAADIKKMGGK